MLDKNFFDMLSRMRLQMNHKSSLNMAGNRKSVQKGVSAEFSDFREYMPGDDLRRLDWNVYARLDKLYIREYMEEKEAVVSCLVDTSASMDYGEKSKADLAKDLAAVVSFLALNDMNRLVLYDMKDMGHEYSVSGGKNAFAKAVKWLDKLEFCGETDMLGAVRKMRRRGSGVTVIISDFLHRDMIFPLSEKKDVSEKEGQEYNYEKLMQYLVYCRQRPVVLHTLAEEELRIGMEGTLNLIDAETESTLKLTVDAEAVRRYEKALNRLMERMKKGCAAAGGAYALCDAGKDRKQMVFQDLRVIYDI